MNTQDRKPGEAALREALDIATDALDHYQHGGSIYRSVAATALDKIRALAAQAAKPLDDPRLQELFTSCIDGALTSGYQGVAVPPEGHWLAFWWKKGQAVAMVEEGARNAAAIAAKGKTE